MTKIITINSCRECPYAKSFSREGMLDVFTCRKMKVQLALRYDKTIHTDCKLNDLPTVEDIEYFSRSASATVQMARTDGANFVINKINEQH